MANSFLSEIRLFSFNFPPRGWALCDGRLLPINLNQALFSLLGTTYGGDGRTTFALPDLRGRVPLGIDEGLPVQPYLLGRKGGSETVTLATAEMPQHTHAIDVSQLTATPACKNGVANQRGPVGNVPAIEASGVTATYSTAAPDAVLGNAALTTAVTAGNAGGGVAHENRQPYLALSYCIALVGIYPSRP